MNNSPTITTKEIIIILCVSLVTCFIAFKCSFECKKRYDAEMKRIDKQILENQKKIDQFWKTYDTNNDNTAHDDPIDSMTTTELGIAIERLFNECVRDTYTTY